LSCPDYRSAAVPRSSVRPAEGPISSRPAAAKAARRCGARRRAPHLREVPAAPVALPRIKRHILIVKKGLQAKFILLVAASVFLAVLLMGWDLYYTFGKDIMRDLMDPGLYELFQKIGHVLMAKLAIYMAVVVIVALSVLTLSDLQKTL